MEIKINSELKQQISDIEFVAGGTVNQLQPLSAYTWSLGTDNTTNTWVPVLSNNVWEHRDIPTTYNSTAPTLTGLTVNGAATVNSITINSGFGEKYTFTKSVTPTTDWTDVGIARTDLPTGAYIVYMTGIYDSNMGWQDGNVYVGLMAWFDSGTNSSERYEIPLHTAGHAHNDYTISLATLSHPGNTTNTTLQIKSSIAFSRATNIKFTFIKLI